MNRSIKPMQVGFNKDVAAQARPEQDEVGYIQLDLELPTPVDIDADAQKEAAASSKKARHIIPILGGLVAVLLLGLLLLTAASQVQAVSPHTGVSVSLQLNPTPPPISQLEIGCDIMHLANLDTKYALPGAGPMIDPITQNFVQVILVRDYHQDGSLSDTFHARALRYTTDCKRLVYSADVQSPVGLAGSSISIYYAGQTDLLTKVYRGVVDPANVTGPEYVFFGTANRLPNGVPGAGNWQDGILTVYVGDLSQR